MWSWQASQSVSLSQIRDSHSKKQGLLRNKYIRLSFSLCQDALKGGEALHPEGKVLKLSKDTNQKLQEVPGN